MKNVNVGLFHASELGRELGKKGTESDILMFNRKKGDTIMTFLAPAEGKLAAKTQIMSVIDLAIVSFAEVTPELGETILMLDAFGIAKGIILIPQYADSEKMKGMVAGTSLASFEMQEFEIPRVLEILEGFNPERDAESPTRVVIDHAFNVKGVGEVVLGFVKSGILKKHDKLSLLPAGKEVLVRSIQMHDDDFDEAPAGSRVGLAIKGAVVGEMRRGSVLCAPGSVEMSDRIRLSFEPNRFYPGGVTEGAVHMTVGMQTVPVRVSDVGDGKIEIESEKRIAYAREDTFLFLDLNAEKLHLRGKGRVISASSAVL